MRAGVKCGSVDVRMPNVPTCKMQTNIADIICGCDVYSAEVTGGADVENQYRFACFPIRYD